MQNGLGVEGDRPRSSNPGQPAESEPGRRDGRSTNLRESSSTSGAFARAALFAAPAAASG